MKTLVLCVDRDNDLGLKARVKSPILGRSHTFKAAAKLALKDPEDSDVNSLFAGISTFDDLKRHGEDVEIAVICGDVNVGLKSDRALSAQLDSVNLKTKPEEVILISDGAEDEHIYPIISSRVRVNHVKRVVVKQAAGLESTFHMILKTLREEKVRRKFGIPIALALLVYGLFSIAGLGHVGIGALFATLGSAMFVVIFDLEENLLTIVSDLKVSVSTSGLSLPFSIISAVLIIIGILLGLKDWGASDEVAENVLWFVNSILWWVVMGSIIFAVGKALDIYIKDKKFASNFAVIIISILGTGLLISGAVFFIAFMLNYDTPEGVVGRNQLLLRSFTDFVFGISLTIAGTYLYRYIKDKFGKDEEKEANWRQ